MGTYRRFYIDAYIGNTELPDVLRFIQEKSIEDAWRKWSDYSKWWALDEMKELSLAFPSIMFSIHSAGEDGAFKHFYLNGVEVEDCFAIYPFPSKAAFARGIIKQKQHQVQQKKAHELAMLKRADIERKEKIAKLEVELNQLKAG